MLIYYPDSSDEGCFCTLVVSEVRVVPHGSSETVKFIEIIAGCEKYVFRLQEDAHCCVDDAVNVIALCMEEDIEVSNYSQRDYLFIGRRNDTSGRQLQITGKKIDNNYSPNM